MTPRYIYLHGFASAPTSRKAQFFREKFASKSIDVRIPALDEGDFTALTVGAQLKVVEREAAGASDVVLMGSSLGGYLSALYAARNPDQVSKLVLLAPAFGFPDAGRREWAASGSQSGRKRARFRCSTTAPAPCARFRIGSSRKRKRMRITRK